MEAIKRRSTFPAWCLRTTYIYICLASLPSFHCNSGATLCLSSFSWDQVEEHNMFSSFQSSLISHRMLNTTCVQHALLTKPTKVFTTPNDIRFTKKSCYDWILELNKSLYEVFAHNSFWKLINTHTLDPVQSSDDRDPR